MSLSEKIAMDNWKKDWDRRQAMMIWGIAPAKV